MQTKLTLRLDDELIEAAKAEAARRGTSLSRLVADLFRSLRAGQGEGLDPGNPIRVQDGRVTELGARTRRLLGALDGSESDPEAYRRHLEQKHLGGS